LDLAAARELEEETGMTGQTMAQIGAFGKPGRDPRGHTITVAYVAFCALSKAEREAAVTAGDDAAEAGWFPLSRLPPLAFDHAEIVRAAWGRLRLNGGGHKTWVEDKGTEKELVTMGPAEGAALTQLYLGTKLGFAESEG
jgi:8-oxo-dGTP pyrophosphatase MutT (NUDIX family)